MAPHDCASGAVALRCTCVTPGVVVGGPRLRRPTVGVEPIPRVSNVTLCSEKKVSLKDKLERGPDVTRRPGTSAARRPSRPFGCGYLAGHPGVDSFQAFGLPMCLVWLSIGAAHGLTASHEWIARGRRGAHDRGPGGGCAGTSERPIARSPGRPVQRPCVRPATNRLPGRPAERAAHWRGKTAASRRTRARPTAGMDEAKPRRERRRAAA